MGWSETDELRSRVEIVMSVVLRRNLKQWPFIGVWFCLSFFWTPAQSIELDLEAERFEAVTEDRAARHKILLGRLKKISNALDPKSELSVQGVRHYETFSTAPRVSLEEAIAALQAAAQTDYTTRFVCQGRDCGSSNEWANAVFGEPKLYGLEQSQYYWVGQHRRSSNYWLVYMSKRSNKPVHYRVEWYKPDQINWAGRIEMGFARQGFVRFELSEAQDDLAGLQKGLETWCGGKNVRLVAVTISDFDSGSSPEVRLRETQRIAETMAALFQNSAGGCQYTAHGMGSLVPIEGWTDPRMDLVLQMPARNQN